MGKSKKKLICIFIFVLMAVFSIYFCIDSVISLNEIITLLAETQTEYELIQNGSSIGYGHEQMIKTCKETISSNICKIIFYLANTYIYGTLVINLTKNNLEIKKE